MTLAVSQTRVDLDARKALARAHVDANRLEQALRLYAAILRDNPQDVDTYLAMGDCYLAEGDGETAWLLYQQAARLAPDEPHIQHRLHLARLECPLEAPWLTATQPQAIVQRLTGSEVSMAPAELERAARLLDEILHSPHPAQVVAQRLPEVENLLPALLELNIRQALAEGRPDLAQMLRGLLAEGALPANEHLGLQSQANAPGGQPAGGANPSASPERPLRLLLVGPPEEDQSGGLHMVQRALAGPGCETVMASGLPHDDLRGYDLVIACRPHAAAVYMEALAACVAARLPLVLYLDNDYEKMPLDHPHYETLGLGCAARARAYTSALTLADLICVPSRALAESLASLGYRVRLLPEGWSADGAHWPRPARSRANINLGWIGQPGQVEDVARVRRMILRVMRQFPQVNLVIAGDPQVYHLFDSLPEARRLYLPVMNQEDRPYLLEQVDILLVPLRNTPFNHMLSDRRLMEAGMAGIPWIASPIPAFVDWQAGGLIASDPDEWHTCLRQMILDAQLRESLGQAGRQQAQSRTLEVLRPVWMSAMEEALQIAGKTPRFSR
jgi:glycosyltransferase involved in cell wall biosynthesis